MSATTTHGVKCGNCQGYHPSAMDVKACYMGHRVAPTYEPPRMTTDEAFANIAAGTSPEIRKAAEPVPAPYEPAKGDVHFVDGEYYRVHMSQGTKRPYACRWDGERFEYCRGMIRKLRADTQVTAEQAKAFGDMAKRCCFCSTPIDRPESTAAGYGPKCAARHGLPWG